MHVAFAFLAGLLIGSIALAFATMSSRERLATERDHAQRLFQAAHWLARYNYGHAMALHNVILDEGRMQMHDVEILAEKHLRNAQHYGNVAQQIPLHRLPIHSRQAAVLYNMWVANRHAPDGLLKLEPDIADLPLLWHDSNPLLTQHVRQLEVAVGVARMGLDEPVPEEEVRTLAQQMKTSYVVAEAMLQHVLNRLRGRMEYVLHVQTAEDVLPSIY